MRRLPTVGTQAIKNNVVLIQLVPGIPFNLTVELPQVGIINIVKPAAPPAKDMVMLGYNRIGNGRHCLGPGFSGAYRFLQAC